jgi:probable sporulation protein (polysaccharide deacetylase family)
VCRHTFRAWRWPAVAGILAAGVALFCLLLFFQEPLYRTVSGVKPGVRFQGEPVGRMLHREIENLVASRALAMGRRPVEAVLDENTGGIIPEINGLEMDREATVELLMNAPRDTEVVPVFRETLPAVRWEHYPHRPAYRGNSRKPCISLMINVAWGDEYLGPLLAVLNEGSTRGTFFLTGQWSEKNPELVRQIKEEGHEPANHGYSDAEVFTELEPAQMAESIRKTNEVIYEITGIYPRFFTPHKGEFNDLALEVVARHNMRTVLWTLDTVDWEEPGVERMMERVAGRLEAGAIVLMHPTADTVEFLKRLIPAAQEKGLKIVTVAEMLSPSWY